MTHSQETREKFRQRMLGNTIWVGRRHSPETIEKMRQAKRGLSPSPETREKISQANLGRKRSPQALENLRLAHLRPECREKMRQAAIKRMACPENRERVRQARLRQHFPVKMTTIECLLRDEFRKRRLKFEMHKAMFGRFQPDFVFEQARLIVQADGDYWHGPKSPNKVRDQAFNDMARAKGWSVWRFGETEIHMHAPICARAVARFVRDHGLRFANTACVSVPPILPRTRSSSTPPVE